ncbi:MAG: hypothetical protein KF861_23665, partial [Planctomycetaceae bacterium]|nr:hypothetical protein [Planctomycetaceae bacterium]
HRRLLLSLCLTMFLAGCGNKGPKIASVEGTVLLDGEPLQDAAVVFNPPSGRPAGARTDAEGRYVLNFSKGRKGAIPGTNRVIVTTKSDPRRGPDGEVIPGQDERIPMKYNTKTELSFEVLDGEKNVANFSLDSDGPIARSIRED